MAHGRTRLFTLTLFPRLCYSLVAKPLEMVQCCSAQPIEKTICEDDLAETQMARLLLIGLVCPNCAVRARNALLQMAGVVSADVDWERGLALVDYIPTATTVHDLVQAISAAGDDAEHSSHAVLIP